jgi:hypothetical protein
MAQIQSTSITGSLTVSGPVSGSFFTGSFIGDGSRLTGLPSGGGPSVYKYTGSLNNSIVPLSGSNISTGNFSTVSGGCCNITNARYSHIAGGHRNVIQSPTNECSARGTTISGGIGHNTTGGTVDFTTGDITGTITCCNAGPYSTISGGYRNIALGIYSSILGGNQNRATSNSSTVGGGLNNCSTAITSTVGGGQTNTASGNNSTVSGGLVNTASGYSSTVGGGLYNTATGCISAISGGCGNAASGNCSTVGGGTSHEASGLASTVGGGTLNKGWGGYSTIAGGTDNTSSSYGTTVGGGYGNTASGYFATVAGGGGTFFGTSLGNTASGAYSSILGGRQNTASGACSGILGGCLNNTCNFANSFIVGSNLCATAACYTFVNNLCNVSGGTSDCRLKENINPIPYGLSELTKLEPVSYNFKSDDSKAIKYGFLAQKIQEVMPDLIKYHPTDLVDGDKVLQFEKEAVWASMINAIKELKNRVELLESKLN